MQTNDEGWELCYSHFLYPAFVAAWKSLGVVSGDRVRTEFETCVNHSALLPDKHVALLPAHYYFGFLKLTERGSNLDGARVRAWRTWEPMFDRNQVTNPHLRLERTIFSRASQTRGRKFWDAQYSTTLACRRFLASVDAHSAATAIIVAKKLDHCQILVDVGCGAGTYAAAALRRNRRLKAIMIDRPEVARYLRSKFRTRAVIMSADARVNPWPKGGDVYLLSHFLQDFGRKDRKCILQQAAASIPETAELWIHGHFWDPLDVRPAHVAFSYYLFTRLGGSVLSRQQQISEARSAGFSLRGAHRTSRTQWLLSFSKSSNL